MVVVGVAAEAAAVNRSEGRSWRSFGLQRSWKIPDGSLGARNVRNVGKPPAAMLLASISSASLTPKGSFEVISQWSLEMLPDARYGIIHKVKTSSSGINGEKSCTSENEVRLDRLEKIRANAGRDVSGV